jgi:hypothetical protein
MALYIGKDWRAISKTAKANVRGGEQTTISQWQEPFGRSDTDRERKHVHVQYKAIHSDNLLTKIVIYTTWTYCGNTKSRKGRNCDDSL